MRAVTAETMQNADKTAMNVHGVPGGELMERAGAAVAGLIQSRFGGGDRSVVIVTGKGNNGGDGFVIARLLAESGWSVTIVTTCTDDCYFGDAGMNFIRMPDSVRKIGYGGTSIEEIESLLASAAVVVDAIFGTGLKARISGVSTELVEMINGAGRPVVAVDIPSGVDATTGKVHGAAVSADVTVTFAAAKIGQILYPGAEFCGELVVVDIGIPDEIFEDSPCITFIDHDYAASLIKPRSRTAHKGSFGSVLIVAGSPGMSGAAVMAANSAMRSGAGLVTLAVPRSIHIVAEIKTTEVMTVALPEDEDGFISIKGAARIRRLLEDKDAAAVGPGIGLCEETLNLVREMIEAVRVPLLLDADAINLVSEEISMLAGAEVPLILTPHPGEMSRLTGLSIAEVEADRTGHCAGFAREHNCYILLKGARTVIAAPDGRIAINSTGNPGMATGGAGDVLAGVITALLGQSLDPFDACCLGAYCHGLAGDMAAEAKGEIGLIATDLQELLPNAFEELLKR